MTFNYNEIGSIIITSLKYALKWTGWKWLVLSSIGALSSTLQLGEKFFHWETERSVLFGIGTLISIFLLRFILIFIRECLKYFHEVYTNSVYGDAIVILQESFATTHYYRKTPGHQDIEFMKSMMTFCNNLQIIFEKITQVECSVSIKVPLSNIKVDEKAVLMNLTRDIKHKERDTGQYSEIPHTLIGNTAFISSFNKVIRNTKEKHYLNNSVNNTKNYDNTSKECHPNGVLPYNSELVFPIIPTLTDSNKNYDCHGFICVDSKKENAFSGKYDVAILEGVADGIYDIISERNQFKNTNNEQIQN
jgi:hypothetical protein